MSVPITGGPAGREAAAAGRLQSLLNHSALYAGSNLLQRGVTFLLLPVYARYFTRAEFGAMDQVYQMTLTLILLTSLGLPQGLVRGLHLDTRTEEEREKLIGALVAFLLPVTLVIAGILLALRDPLAALLFRGDGPASWIALGAAFYATMALYQMPLELLKVRRRAPEYVAWSLVTFAAIVSGNVALVVVEGRGLSGMIAANALAYGAVGAILWIRLLPRLALNLEFRRLRPLFAFGLPMLPALLSRKILEAADRYMIPWYHGLEPLGTYVMGAKIAGIVEALLLVPFLYAWQPFFYSLSDDRAAPALFSRVTHYVFLLLLTLFLGLEALRDPVIAFVGNGRYAGSADVVTVLLLAVVFNGLQYCVSAGIHLRRQLPKEAALMGAAAGLNVLLNVLLIPPYYGLGAAIATAAAYLFYLAATFVLAQRYYPVPYAWRRAVLPVLAAIAAFVLMRRFAGVGPRLAIVAAFAAAGPILDLARHGELHRGRRAVTTLQGFGSGPT